MDPSPTPPHSPEPIDRGWLLTEQRNSRTRDLDSLSVRECVRRINEEDATVAHAVAQAGDAIAGFIEAVLERMHGVPDGQARLIYIGAGTSGRLGVLDASECPPTFRTPAGMVLGVIAGGDAALRASSEGREDERYGAVVDLERLHLTRRDSVLGIAAGGTTPYVFGGLEFARREGSLTGLLTCAAVPTPEFVEHHIVLATGPEAVTGSTRMKAGTATKMTLNTISTTIMIRRGKVYENLMVDLRATNEKLRDRAARIISTLTGLPRVDSLALLSRAGGSVKHAVVAHTYRCEMPEAERRLIEAGGDLRAALGDGHAGGSRP